MKHTSIEWAHHTFNAWLGCGPVSEGCRNCYAAAHAARFADANGVFSGLSEFRGAGKNRRAVYTGKLHLTSRDYWRQPMAWNMELDGTRIRQRVFCASMSDWLDPNAPAPWLGALLRLIVLTPNLDWLLLTKRPELFAARMQDVIDYTDGVPAEGVHLVESTIGNIAQDWLLGCSPANAWVGATVENRAAESRIADLLKIDAKVRFLSCEPLLEQIDVASIGWRNAAPRDARVNWVIAGGESGHNPRPVDPDWIRDLRDQCHDGDVPFFFKQWGGPNKKTAGRELDGRTWEQVPA
jgi:protein gp37